MRDKRFKGRLLEWAAVATVIFVAGAAVTFAKDRPSAPGTNASAQSADAPAGYHLVNTYKVGGEGFWDYLTVDSDAHRLYISRGTHVMVVDTESGKIVGDIPNAKRVHGIALAPEFGRGFVSDGSEPSSVIIFDMKTLKTIDVVKITAKDADCIIYDPASKRIFTFSGDDNSAYALDAATGKVLGTIALGGGPEFAVADGKGHIYNNLEDKSEQVEIDTKTLKVTNRWSLAPCEGPSGLAMDVEHRRLFAGCHNEKMAITDPDAHKVITTVPIGAGVDANGFDPGTQLAFSSNGQAGTLTVVHEDSPNKYTVVGNVKTEQSARTMAIDPKTHHIFEVSANMNPRPAAPTPENPRRFPTMVPGTFRVLEYAQ